MTQHERKMTWEMVEGDLRRWHEVRDRNAARRALEFIEVELRLMIPPLVRRTWPQDHVEDAISSFLCMLLERPISEDLVSPRSYFRRAFTNHCIDAYRSRQRLREEPMEETFTPLEMAPLPDEALMDADTRRERSGKLHKVLERMSLADRVVLKLEHAPEWLTSEEISWLAGRSHMDEAGVQEAVASSRTNHALSRIFDPGDDDPDDMAARRKRMERFRRRRARAREKLRAVLEGVI